MRAKVKLIEAVATIIISTCAITAAPMTAWGQDNPFTVDQRATDIVGAELGTQPGTIENILLERGFRVTASTRWEDSNYKSVTYTAKHGGMSDTIEVHFSNRSSGNTAERIVHTIDVETSKKMGVEETLGTFTKKFGEPSYVTHEGACWAYRANKVVQTENCEPEKDLDALNMVHIDVSDGRVTRVVNTITYLSLGRLNAGELTPEQLAEDAQKSLAATDFVSKNCAGLHIDHAKLDQILGEANVLEFDARNSKAYRTLMEDEWPARVKNEGIRKICYNFQVQFLQGVPPKMIRLIYP